jgi:SAM-dependent methyltransferase
VGYFDRHAQPGYYRDLTRHFDRDAELLDVGCWTGWLADQFAHHIGIDGPAEAVALAQQRGRNVICGDIEPSLPFADGIFDAPVLKDVLEHVSDPGAVLDQVRRVLRPGATVFPSSPDAQRWAWEDYSHRRPFTRKAYRLLFIDRGFTLVRVGYESTVPGVGLLSARTRRQRRQRVFARLALLPVRRRNVWLVARR